ncbi:multiple epidermal growth factor-like domains protein 11 isoform X2 [Saccostrea cucullata]|uniref:multiple epidermal growth factor-like domains protein 11 isoform X2 n=1 Tax=Saccostrea cuccullata TaxID=36930 RepID=UPI002ED53C3A
MSLYICFISLLRIFSLAYENLALNKPAYQDHPYFSNQWGADKAVDGKYDSLTSNAGQCVISANGQTTATWWVNLEGVYSISHINIIYRTDNLPHPSPYVPRLAGFFLYVSNTSSREDSHLCFHEIQKVNGTPSENQTTKCPVHGQYVIFYNERKSGVKYPSYYSNYAFNELCELQVFGCERAGFYGENCNLPCSNTCQNSLCHIHTGECYGCVPGYQGSRCEQLCSTGSYGSRCSSSCGNCRKGETCHHVNGTCLNGCGEGFQGTTCEQGCRKGYFGENCTQKCSNNCRLPNSCNSVTGECDGGCQYGWTGRLCETGCGKGYFGENCTQKCSNNCRLPNSCNSVTGECDGGCQYGWTGRLCETGNLCPCAAESSNMFTTIIVNSVVTLFIVLISNVIIYIVRRRKKLNAGHGR